MTHTEKGIAIVSLDIVKRMMARPIEDFEKFYKDQDEFTERLYQENPELAKAITAQIMSLRVMNKDEGFIGYVTTCICQVLMMLEEAEENYRKE